MLVYTLARVRLCDGYMQTLGQPFATLQLYERNFIHLSMSLFSRDLPALGCRFDESMHILQDWDFFLQCAQHTRFHFEPRETFEWRADAGTSGAGAGANQTTRVSRSIAIASTPNGPRTTRHSSIGSRRTFATRRHARSTATLPGRKRDAGTS